LFQTSGFTVRSATGPDDGSLIRHQVETARRTGCRGVVWAELTMPEDEVYRLRACLQSSALDEGTAPEFVLSGSWHRIVDGAVRNVATVFDGAGSEILQLTKWAPFTIGDRVEDIAPGQEIPVLLTETSLAVLAICRDFLDDAAEPPYTRLNVELAFVPSMAGAEGRMATLRGHASTANSMRIRYGTRTLVVLQPPQPEGNELGHLLIFPERPLEADPVEAHDVLVPCPLATR
jgi:hypothetical protein